ncbi:DUF1963 domain-containing protein [Streptomyces sp. YU58]|uniref:DUF1963 domain-containing protein n=1 Tax=Streptomyces sp. SX92 TaxID=3158972 RepID=UPI0027BACE85|nr:DUF1963 domain-containing protein [Streptomyces coralus]WLW54844.1 DUF1963 domain-containing protein [Streptomyces coralus]
MTPEEMRERLGPFRDMAVARGIPVEDVERWTDDTARPCVTLAEGGDGPVVGRFGGPLLLPVGTPHPFHPFVASIDLAALPAGATDLPLPPDGRLLLFAYPENFGDGENMGSAVYVPVGTAVEERDKEGWAWFDTHDEYQEVFAQFPQETLRATVDVSLPYHHCVEIPEEPYSEPLPGHPRAEELAEVWQETQDDISSPGQLQLGGYADEEAIDADPVAQAMRYAIREAAAGRWGGGAPVSGDLADWVLLADWNPWIDGLEGATVHWAIPREDLAARRFERVFTTVFWNP